MEEAWTEWLAAKRKQAAGRWAGGKGCCRGSNSAALHRHGDADVRVRCSADGRSGSVCTPVQLTTEPVQVWRIRASVRGTR